MVVSCSLSFYFTVVAAVAAVCGGRVLGGFWRVCFKPSHFFLHKIPIEFLFITNNIFYLGGLGGLGGFFKNGGK